MKNFIKLSLAALMGVATVSSGIALTNAKAATVESANASVATYYQNIGDDLTGNDLLTALHSLNSSKRNRTVGYDGFRQFAAKCDKDPDGTKIVGFYDNALLGPNWDSGSTWNREHVWPKSRNGSAVENDAHMVRAAAKKTNGDRGNDFFATGVYDPGSFIANYRGIAARIIFYCAIADTSLHLVDLNDDSTSNGTMGKLSDLLQWNLDYLPSTSSSAPLELRVEQNRNNVIEQDSRGQGNRNPFIDHPEYACKIWGNTNSETKRICGTSTTAPTSITVSASKNSLAVGTSIQANATANSGASNSVTWSSNRTSVATVDESGNITGVSAGSATITATSTLNSSVKGTFNVTVYEASVTGISVSGQKTSFKTGNSFAFNGTVTANLSDGSSKDVTSNATFSGYNLSTAGNQTVTVTYTEKGHNYTTTYGIVVADASASNTFTKFTGEIEEGTYLIAGQDGNKMLKASVSNNRLQAEDVTVTDDTVNEPDESLIWEISKNGNSYELYNEATASYAASNGTKNQSALSETSNAKTLWTITGSSTYEIVNDSNKSSSVNANLRYNPGVGFACYSTGTGTPLTLYKMESAPVVNVPVTGITLNTDELYLNVNQSSTVVATVLPTNATNKTVTWTTDDDEVATVNDGVVTAVAPGDCVITATTQDGSFKANLDVYVGTSVVTLSSISVSGTPTTSYKVGDTFVKPTIMAHYSNNTDVDVTNDATFSGYDLSTAGNQTVTVTYGGKSTSYDITVSSGTSGNNEYTIEFKKNSNDSGTILSTAELLKGEITSGADYIDSVTSYDKVYGGKNGIKFGNSSNPGNITFTLTAEGQLNATKIHIGIAKYNSDSSNVEITTNISEKQTFTPTSNSTIDDFEFDVSGVLTTITLNSTGKRAYVSYITVVGGGTASKVDVTGVSFENESINVNVNETKTLSPVVAPSNATNKAVSYTSANESICTVDDKGKITGVAKGTTTVTVTTDDGGFTATITVNVVLEHGKSVTDPLTPGEAIEKVDAHDTGSYYVIGIVTSIAETWKSQYSNFSVYVQPEDQTGVTFEFFRVASASDPNIKVGDTLCVYGTLTKYNTTYETSAGAVVANITTVEQKAAAFAKAFNDANVCGTNDNTPAIASVWADMKIEFNKLDSYTKEYLSNVATADTTDEDIKEAIARYDMVLSKRAGFEDFMSRNGGPSSNIVRTTSDGSATIIASIALISLLAFAYFYYRKKKLAK